jgi:hypothetical protein
VLAVHYFTLSPAKLAQTVTILTYHLEVPGSNLAPGTDYSYRVFIFVVFLILSSIVPWNRPLRLPSAFFQFTNHYRSVRR